MTRTASSSLSSLSSSSAQDLEVYSHWEVFEAEEKITTSPRRRHPQNQNEHNNNEAMFHRGVVHRHSPSCKHNTTVYQQQSTSSYTNDKHDCETGGKQQKRRQQQHHHRQQRRLYMNASFLTKVKIVIIFVLLFLTLMGWFVVEFRVWQKQHEYLQKVAIPDGVSGPMTWQDLFNQANEMKLLDGPTEGVEVMEFHAQHNWNPLGKTSEPYSVMTPQLDVIWSRGWYNAIPPPKTVPLYYYNHAGLEGGALHEEGQLKLQFPPFLCGPRWMRINDVAWWAETILPDQQCEFTLITSDGMFDVPFHIPGADKVLASPLLQVWYSQNVVMKHPKLQPIPLGMPIHYGFPESPHSAHTVQNMLEIRTRVASPLSSPNRSRKILLDPGTFGATGPRTNARTDAVNALAKCPNRVEIMESTPVLDTWEHKYSQHQFAIAVRGTGWDTYRTWEYLLFGTVPIVLKKFPMEHLHQSAHTPVVMVTSWSDICDWSDDDYNQLATRYEGWVANAHHWLRPSLWVPRNQTEMDRLCDISPGCRDDNSATTTVTKNTKAEPLQLVDAEIDDDQAEAQITTEDTNKEEDHDDVVVPKEIDGNLAGLTPNEQEQMLHILLKRASQDEIEKLLLDSVIKEKVYHQLLLGSKADT